MQQPKLRNDPDGLFRPSREEMVYQDGGSPHFFYKIIKFEWKTIIKKNVKKVILSSYVFLNYHNVKIMHNVRIGKDFLIVLLSLFCNFANNE